jgi:hypothetical protein
MAAMMATERLWPMTGPGPEPVARNAVNWRQCVVATGSGLRRPVEPAGENRKSSVDRQNDANDPTRTSARCQPVRALAIKSSGAAGGSESPNARPSMPRLRDQDRLAVRNSLGCHLLPLPPRLGRCSSRFEPQGGCDRYRPAFPPAD